MVLTLPVQVRHEEGRFPSCSFLPSSKHPVKAPLLPYATLVQKKDSLRSRTFIHKYKSAIQIRKAITRLCFVVVFRLKEQLTLTCSPLVAPPPQSHPTLHQWYLHKQYLKSWVKERTSRAYLRTSIVWVWGNTPCTFVSFPQSPQIEQWSWKEDLNTVC